MKLSQIALIVGVLFASASPLLGTISSPPEPMEVRFNQADSVCAGAIQSATKANEVRSADVGVG